MDLYPSDGIPMKQFQEVIRAGYAFEGPSILLGAAVLDGQPVDNLQVKAPLRTFNRHGLIAGATGTGKTKTFQVLAEALSASGVPLLVMDMKGDLSGLSRPGTENPKIDARHRHIGSPWKPEQYPVELLSISEEKGVRLRATVSEFGPVLFSKMLNLNELQSGVVSLVFKYCDDRSFPLVDLKDFKKALQYLTNEGKDEIEQEYGRISTASTGSIMRQIIELEEQGAAGFFGEPSFDVEDLLRIDERGRGTINILRLSDVQSKPRMFSTFMLCLLAEIYERFPEEGDLEQPKLVMFIDEAHLIFSEASRALVDQLETTIKLIRSKGIGVFFCTQNPADIPAAILGQLGMKIQHALRAFTANDRKAIKLAAENYPLTDFYRTDEVITSLGIGEALVTLLNEKGVPTPLAHTLLRAPESRMDILEEPEIDELVRTSALASRYMEAVDSRSAYELLSERMAQARTARPETVSAKGRKEKTGFEKVVTNPVTRQVTTVIARELTRGLLGVLGLGRRR
jgi:DNA helicase HerA-like ATPase